MKEKPYQDFGGGGSSDSPKKMAKLGLPDDMSGIRVLDLGCNAGYFCIEAAKRGATCVGIEVNETKHSEAVENAGKYGVADKCEFICGGWGNVLPLLPERFDIILWTSAVHYERNQRTVARLAYRKIKPSGMLVIECGIIGSPVSNGPLVQRVSRGNGSSVPHFSEEYLRNRLLVGLFDCRVIGPSINQVGDHVPRYVVHCYPKKPVFHVVRGCSGIGKSALGSNLANLEGSVLLRVDDYFFDLELQKGGELPDSDFSRMKKCFNQFRNKDGTAFRVDLAFNHLVENGHAAAIADMILEIVSKDFDYVLEGYLTDPVMDHLQAKLAEQGWKVWETVLASSRKV